MMRISEMQLRLSNCSVPSPAMAVVVNPSSLSCSLLGAKSLLLLHWFLPPPRHLSHAVCSAAALGLQFSFLAAFAWMTIFSLDICSTFRGVARASRALHRT